MAGGIDWLRWHHGSVTDPKFQLVARRAGASVAEVVAVWAFLLEQASMSDDRGNPGEPDLESIDCALGMEDGRAHAIYTHMLNRALVSEDGRITSWDKRQPKREREDDNSSERVRAFRQKKRNETPCNAEQHQETPRGEERREEVNLTTANAVVVPSPAEAEPETPDDGKFLPCPHDKVVALYHEALPVLPRIREWTAARQQTLRSRWRAKCAELHWSSEADGIAWFSRFFAYVSESEFLCGRSQPPPGRTPFVADLEWLLKPANFTKVVEGKYHA